MGLPRAPHFSDADNQSAAPAQPAYKNFAIYCDETGMGGGHQYYGFGSLWIPWERRGDLAAILRERRERHFDRELKWGGVNGRTLEMYRELIDEFFRRRWMMFHCLLVPRATVDPGKHRDREEAMRKHYTLLLTNKIRTFALGRSDRRYRIRVDRLDCFGYQKSHEAIEAVGNNVLNKRMRERLIEDVLAVDSKETAGVQLADVLLGAVASVWQKKQPSNSGKLQFRDELAGYLGWPDLKADTGPEQWKFNIWHFHDGGPRVAKTREVALRYEMPPFRRGVSRTSSSHCTQTEQGCR